MTIRRLGPDDAPAAARLDRDAFERSWSGRALARLARAGGLFGALDGDAVVGFLAGQVVVDRAEILRIVVSDPWRRRGVGRALVAAFVDAVRADASPVVRDIDLDVRRDALGARAFYERLGFRCVGERPNYYPTADGPVDAVLMSRALDEG